MNRVLPGQRHGDDGMAELVAGDESRSFGIGSRFFFSKPATMRSTACGEIGQMQPVGARPR